MNEDLFQVGAKAVIRDTDGRVLLIKISNPKKKYWDLPGGRMQKESTIEETLRREIQEETGIVDIQDVKPLTTFITHIRLPINQDQTSGLVFFVYSCLLAKKCEIVLSDEHTEYKWATPEEAATLLSRFSISFI